MSPRKTQYRPKKHHVKDNKPDLLQVLSTLYPQKIVKKRRSKIKTINLSLRCINDFVISEEIPNIESYDHELVVGFFLDVPNF
ncbi:hypothetical protein TSUD_321910 [Trifolium subterraneum]|uniref:Uncharacterized protein n=1 Tax=Trifolium subterraneum TaxID=3900 RepID=A0A2Z6NIB6_TRISU|nr:hypothetical protein TSUD_321910 [Trifolium subterraneum]